MVKGRKIASLILVTAMAFSILTACGDNAVPAMATVGAESGLSAYELAVQQGYDGTLEDWLRSLQGKTAYEIAVEHGYTGTEDEWIGRLNSLAADGGTYVKTASFNSAGQLILTLSDNTTVNIGGGLAAKGSDGADGRDGTNGTNGKDGKNGKDGTSVTGVNVNEKGELIVSFSDGKATNVGKIVGTAGLDGKNGLSAYEIAVITGTTTAATEAEWIESLKGANGTDGQTPYVGDNGNWWIGTTDTGVVAGGRNGIDGADGKSAYEIAKENGCTLSEVAWLASLKGADGQNGSNGKSAYETAKDAGLTTAATEAEWIESLKGAAGETGQDGRDGDTPFIGENGNWWIGSVDTNVKAAGPQGEKGLKGDKGETGAQGASGKSAYEIAIEKNLITNAVTEEQWLASLKGEQGSQGEQGVGIQNITLNNGTMTITLTDNTQFQFENVGAASSGGTVPQVRINTQTNEWEISSDNGSSWVSTGVKATGEKGADGVNGKDGIAPKVQINAITNEWEISVNNGLSWTSTGVKATGVDGKDGADGQDGKDGDTPFIGANGNWWIGTTDTGVKAAGQNGQDGKDGVDGKDGADGQDGKDGDTPFIGANGNWWIGTTDTGVKAAGQNYQDGKDGVDGKDGDTPFIGDNGNWWIGTTDTGVKAAGQNGQDGKDGVDGKDGDTPFIGANGNWWIGTTDTGVKAAGQNGQDGKDGVDGKDGADGQDGKDGVSVTGVTINEENKLVITLSEGDPIIIDKSLMGATGAAGADGKDGNGISTVTLTPDFYLVFYYTDGTNSGKLGPIKGEKGDKGDAGVGIANVSLDASGNLYITYSNTDVPILLGNARGPKGDTGPAGPKGDPGADGKDGRGIKNAYVNSERHLILEMTDGSTIDAGYVGVSDVPANTHTVIFQDWDGTELKRESVADGASAAAPSDPVRDGYTFAGWDKSFSKVTADMVITAQYEELSKDPMFIVKSVDASKGATQVSVAVSIKNNPGFMDLILKISYDTDALQLTGVNAVSPFNSAPYSCTKPSNLKSGRAMVMWASNDVISNPTDGDLIVLSFTVLDTATAGNHFVTISCADGIGVDIDKDIYIPVADATGYVNVR